MSDEQTDIDDTVSDDLFVRPATMEDALQVSEILSEAFPALYTWTFGHLNSTQISQLLFSLFRSGTLSLKHTYLAATSTQVLGLIILHHQGTIGQGTVANYLRAVTACLRGMKALRAFTGGLFANIMISHRIPHGDDIVYVEALAVAVKQRGIGIGSRLLQEAIRVSCLQDKRRISLHVLQTNLVARRLYTRMGFRFANPLHNQIRPQVLVRAGYHFLMTRDL